MSHEECSLGCERNGSIGNDKCVSYSFDESNDDSGLLEHSENVAMPVGHCRYYNVQLNVSNTKIKENSWVAFKKSKYVKTYSLRHFFKKICI